MSIETRIRKIVNKTCRIDESDITLDSRLDEDLKLDSLDIVDVMLDIEEEFNIIVPDASMYDTRTVGDIVVMVQNLEERQKQNDAKRFQTHN